MKFIKLELPEIVKIKSSVHYDSRGSFWESWREKSFIENIGTFKFVQENNSKSVQGTLRGLHYQIANPQGKLIKIISGTIFDVAVDLRRSSSTFGKWVGALLSDQEPASLWIPPGFAHGFYVLSNLAQIIYHCTDYYSPENERTVRWDDSLVGVEWPILQGTTPLLSEKDSNASDLSSAETYL